MGARIEGKVDAGLVVRNVNGQWVAVETVFAEDPLLAVDARGDELIGVAARGDRECAAPAPLVLGELGLVAGRVEVTRAAEGGLEVADDGDLGRRREGSDIQRLRPGKRRAVAVSRCCLGREGQEQAREQRQRAEQMHGQRTARSCPYGSGTSTCKATHRRPPRSGPSRLCAPPIPTSGGP